MTSQINFGAINTSYPVAGVDNNSQGFRDNFTAISAGLATAKTELTALQANAVLKANLTTNAVVNNDLNGSTISNGLYNRFYGVYFSGGTVSAAANIDLVNGPVQKFVLSGNATLTFTGWPTAGKMGLIRVLVASDLNGVRTPGFATSGGGTIRYDVAYPTLPNSSSPGFKVGGESVRSVTVTEAGSRYITPTTISFTSPTLAGGTSATATATYKVLSATVTSGALGSNYANGDLLVVNQESTIVLSVTGVNGSGGITNLSVSVNGPLLTPLAGSKTVTALTGSGTGASVDLVCAIDTINVTDSGDGWTTVPPNVTIGAPAVTGIQATATAVLTTITTDNVKVIEAWSIDSGLNVYLRYIGEYN
jgi:hypothetical protein